jgi:hypothetical protein
LPIPPLIDAAKQGGAVGLKVTLWAACFPCGQAGASYGYSGPVLGPAIRLRRGDEVGMTVENVSERGGDGCRIVMHDRQALHSVVGIAAGCRGAGGRAQRM